MWLRGSLGLFSGGLVLMSSTCSSVSPPVATSKLAPQQSLEAMQVAEGLEVSLFAAEPELRNPTAIDVDAEGRVWVAEAVNYRLFNQDVVEPKGDRIRVLEDTDGDGRADEAHTFYQDPSLQSPMCVAVLGDRVYVCQSPELFYLQDLDGDGVADRKTVVLDGFGGVDHDHGIHGVVFGPDGLLYMSNGDEGLDVTDGSGHRIRVGGEGEPYRAATVLRSDLEGKHLEVLADGMRNPYEPAVDSFGIVFISDNDDDGNQQCRVNYVMEGGYYGYWPHRMGDRRLDAVHWNEDRPGVIPKMIRTGFGAPAGMAVYEGDLLPSRLQGTLLHADAGPGVVRAYRPQRSGAGFRAQVEVLLSSEKDDWFRPIDVVVAPDGSLIVADWFDPGVGGHRMDDVEGGRLYRLAPGGSHYKMPPLDLESPGGLQAALSSANPARRFLAYQTLSRAVDAGHTSLVEEMFSSGSAWLRARSLWLAGRQPELGTRLALEAARAASPNLRTLAVRVLSRLGAGALSQAHWLRTDDDPAVRRQLILELSRISPENPWVDEWLLDLAAQFDGQDRYYREALGIGFKGREKWALRALLDRIGTRWNAQVASLAFQLHTPEAEALAVKGLQSRTRVLRELAVRTLDAIQSVSAGTHLMKQLHSGRPQQQELVLDLLGRDGGRVWAATLEGTDIEEFLTQSLENPTLQQAALRFITGTGRIHFLPRFLQIATDLSLPEEERRQAARDAADTINHHQGLLQEPQVEKLVALLNDPDSEIQESAVRILNAYGYDRASELLRMIVADLERDPGLRQETVELLSRSKSGSLMLLNMVESGDLPADLEALVAQRLHRSAHEDVRLLAAENFPQETTREGSPLPPAETLLAMVGDPERGRALFYRSDVAQCSNCHRVQGEGRDIGPDLSSIGQKYGKQEMLDSILYPSAAIGHEYRAWVLRTQGQGYLIGFIKDDSDSSLELIDSDGRVFAVNKSEIVDRYPSRSSLMPNGLVSGMTPQELVDVVAFLQVQR